MQGKLSAPSASSVPPKSVQPLLESKEAENGFDQRLALAVALLSVRVGHGLT